MGQDTLWDWGANQADMVDMNIETIEWTLGQLESTVGKPLLQAWHTFKNNITRWRVGAITCDATDIGGFTRFDFLSTLGCLAYTTDTPLAPVPFLRLGLKTCPDNTFSGLSGSYASDELRAYIEQLHSTTSESCDQIVLAGNLLEALWNDGWTPWYCNQLYSGMSFELIVRRDDKQIDIQVNYGALLEREKVIAAFIATGDEKPDTKAVAYIQTLFESGDLGVRHLHYDASDMYYGEYGLAVEVIATSDRLCVLYGHPNPDIGHTLWAVISNVVDGMITDAYLVYGDTTHTEIDIPFGRIPPTDTHHDASVDTECRDDGDDLEISLDDDHEVFHTPTNSGAQYTPQFHPESPTSTRSVTSRDGSGKRITLALTAMLGELKRSTQRRRLIDARKLRRATHQRVCAKSREPRGRTQHYRL